MLTKSPIYQFSTALCKLIPHYLTKIRLCLIGWVSCNLLVSGRATIEGMNASPLVIARNTYGSSTTCKIAEAALYFIGNK